MSDSSAITESAVAEAVSAAIAAVEAAVGLALVIALYRHKRSVSLDDVHELQG